MLPQSWCYFQRKPHLQHIYNLGPSIEIAYCIFGGLGIFLHRGISWPTRSPRWPYYAMHFLSGEVTWPSCSSTGPVSSTWCARQHTRSMGRQNCPQRFTSLFKMPWRKKTSKTFNFFSQVLENIPIAYLTMELIKVHLKSKNGSSNSTAVMNYQGVSENTVNVDFF